MIKCPDRNSEVARLVSGLARKNSPRSQMRYPQRWPHAPLRKGGEPAALCVQGIAARLIDAMAAIGQPSIRQLSRDSGVNHQTINTLISGESWPDVMTVVRLEIALGAALWPSAESPVLGQIANPSHRDARR